MTAEHFLIFSLGVVSASLLFVVIVTAAAVAEWREENGEPKPRRKAGVADLVKARFSGHI
jgi:hypothetical protein